MDITQPEFIPVPWAANGQKASIPEEQTSAGNGRASWKTGFPTENTLPVSQGGVPANYQDFQGVLYSLSENVCYQQAGGMFTWSNTIDYQNGARVLGSDGKAYIATGKNGPSTTVVNPVGDTSGKWILDANMNQVSSAASAITQNYVTSGGYTVSSGVTYSGDVTVSGTVNGGGVVHLVGNETVSGTKTFASTISGNITGSASSAGYATSATNDGSGNAITSTYATKQEAKLPDFILNAQNLVSVSDFENGGLDSNGKNAPNNTRVRLAGFLTLEKGVAYAFYSDQPGLLCSVSFYTASGDYTLARSAASLFSPSGMFIVGQEGALYARILLKFSDERAFVVSDLTSIVFTPLKTNSGNEDQKYLQDRMVTHVTHNGAGSYIVDSRRNAMTTPVCFSHDVNISVPILTNSLAIQLYDGYETGASHLIGTKTWAPQHYIPAWSYFCYIVRNNNDSSTSINDNSLVSVVSENGAAQRTKENFDIITSIEDCVVIPTFKPGSINADGTITASTSKVYTPDIFYFPSKINVPGERNYSLLMYRNDTYLGKINSSGTLDKIAGNWKTFSGLTDMTALLKQYNATGCRFTLGAGSNITTDELAQAYGELNCVYTAKKYTPLEWANGTFFKHDSTSTNYVIGADFIKRNIKYALLGTLTYLQSFCVYDGKYYSTNGSNIAIQNSDFSAVSTTALTVGHGNNFQLGSSNLAYISGWDDQKIYVVDMDTLTLDSTITLPTTGYTTCVVDDLNNIAYIFQRDTTPSTETNYNFIVYDITNEQVLSTRVIRAYAAMQAADYYEGKIIVNYGLGTSTAPNGTFICNTAGDILADFNLSFIASTEPEGVFIERGEGTILISTVGKSVYRISME